MIVDTSAIVAIANTEPNHEQLLEKLRGSSLVGIGAPTLAESSIVLSARFGISGQRWLLGFVELAAVEVIPLGRGHWLRAADAWERYGKGRHEAALNFGDCLAYATAKVAGRPLLCVGDDFARTDLAIA